MHELYGSAHCHTDRSNFRLRDSTNRLDVLCKYAAELGHNFIAITDHETVSTAIDCQDVEKEIRKNYPDFKVIRGNEIYLCRNELNAENFVKKEDKFFHWILLAKDEEGHRQIREISTRAWLRAFTMNRMLRVPTYYNDLFEVIKTNRGHVIGSTACIGGFLGQQLLKYRDSENEEDYEFAKYWVTNMKEIFGEGNFFLETQPSFNKEQIYVNNMLRRMSEELNIPVIITLDAHYLKKEDAGIHEAFLNAQGGDREVKSFYSSTYMMSTDEIHEYMDEFLGKETVSKWLTNTQLIYNACTDYDLTKPLHIPYLPKTIDNITDELFFKYKDKLSELEYFYKSPYQENRDMAAAIVTKIENGAADEFGDEFFYEVNDNLKSIRLASEKQDARWSAYLLNLRDYIRIIWEKGNSLVGPSRGSGGGFFLLHLLDVIQINKLKEKMGMFSWRFLNPERVSPLDVDIDIEGGKRPQVYKALQDSYGADRVSKVLTIRTEKSKSAILTACRGHGISTEEANYLSSFIKSDRGQARTLRQTYYGDVEASIKPDLKFAELMSVKYPEVWETAQYIEGLCCGVGSHAGGVIFYDDDITNSTALMQTTNGDVVTQYDLHVAEKVGQLWAV